MTQDMSNKMNIENTRGLSPCVLSLLLMVVGMDTAWGYNSGSNYGEFAINTSQF